jgi:hypothetical protein
MGLLVVQTQPLVLGLPSDGSIYYYNVNTRWTTQEDLGEVYVIDQLTTCRIAILHAILVGIRYQVRFNGYGVPYPNNYISTNSSVDFSSNLVSFDLVTRDYDGDNRSTYTRIYNTPHYNPLEACAIFLVTPDWTAHETTWNLSVNQITDNWCVNHALTTMYHTGRGEFQYSIPVNFEGYATIAGQRLQVNGTTTFGFYCSYDANGVLLQYSASSSNHFYNDFNQITQTSSVTITRAAIDPFFVAAYPFMIYQVLLAVIALLVGVGCGFWLGKRHRGM